MEHAYPSLTEKLTVNRGYTAVECLLAVTVIAICMTLTSVRIRPLAIRQETQDAINDIVMDQYQAVVDCQHRENRYTGFNRKGNVRMRDTVYIDGVAVIISLGTGRIYVRE